MEAEVAKEGGRVTRGWPAGDVAGFLERALGSAMERERLSALVAGVPSKQVSRVRFPGQSTESITPECLEGL